MPEEEKKYRGERGPDKKPRVHGGGRKKKPDEEKTKTRPVNLLDWENEYLIDKYGSRTTAIKTLVPKKKPKK